MAEKDMSLRPLGLPTSRPYAIEPTAKSSRVCDGSAPTSQRFVHRSRRATSRCGAGTGHGRSDTAGRARMSIVSEIKAEGDAAVRRWALELDGAEPARADARRRPAPARGDPRARRPRAPLARGAAAARRRARGRARRRARAQVGPARDGRRLRAAQPRLHARHVRRPRAGGGRRADRRLHAAAGRRPRRRRGRAARDRRGLGARRAAGDRLARVRPPRRQDRRPRQPVRERREARGLARRPDRPAGRAVRGGRRRRRRAPTRASSSSSSPPSASTGTTRPAPSSPRSRRPRRSRPSTSCCSASPRRAPSDVRNAGAVFVGSSAPVAAGDYATGGNHVLPTGGWARSVGGLGLETFLKPITIQRITPEGLALHPPDGRGARRRRGHDRARRGGAAMKPLAPEFKAYTWSLTSPEVAAARRDRPVAGRALRPEHAAAAAALDAARHDRRRARRHQQLPARRLRRPAPRDRRLRRRRPRPDRARRRAPTT